MLRRLLPAEQQTHDWMDPSGKVVLVEYGIPAAWCGKKLSALNEAGSFWLTAVTRFGAAEVVDTNAIGQEGDVLLFVSGVETPRRTAGAPRAGSGALMRVGIAGAGAVGLFIANDLIGSGHEVLLIEQQPRVQERAVTDPGVEWCIGDACEVTLLRDAGLDKCDVVVAATGDDEDNLVVSLLAKTEFAVPRVIARVNNPKNEWLFNENWGVDLSVSTPHLITALVEEAVEVGRLVRILQFERGQARLVEVTLAPDARGRRHGDLRHRPPPRLDLRRDRARRPRRDADEATRSSRQATKCSRWSPPTPKKRSAASSPGG